MQAAAAALGENRSPDNPLLVGSVKTNIGHLEAAAGMAGIIKVLLSMQHNRIAGQMGFENPNPHIAWERTPVKVLTEMTEWPDLERKIAGVSAFGMSGTNAHVIIEEPPQREVPKSITHENIRPQLVFGKRQAGRVALLSGRRVRQRADQSGFGPRRRQPHDHAGTQSLSPSIGGGSSYAGRCN